jgi:hypothetical protein
MDIYCVNCIVFLGDERSSVWSRGEMSDFSNKRKCNVKVLSKGIQNNEGSQRERKDSNWSHWSVWNSGVRAVNETENMNAVIKQSTECAEMFKKFLELNMWISEPYYLNGFSILMLVVCIFFIVFKRKPGTFTEMGMAAYRHLMSNIEWCHS